MSKTYYVYILASKPNGTLYIGVTNNLERRMVEHKNGLAEGFTKKYKIYSLVHYEETNDIYSALQREKQLKKWNRNGRWRSLNGKIPIGMILRKTGFPIRAFGNDTRVSMQRC